MRVRVLRGKKQIARTSARVVKLKRPAPDPGPTPEPDPDFTKSTISAGQDHACAVRDSGRVACWGGNRFGQLGNGEDGIDPDTGEGIFSPVPVEVRGVGGDGVLSDVVEIAVGATHTCALQESGQVLCWGNNYYGTVGNDLAYLGEATPVKVHGVNGHGTLDDVVSVSAGKEHTCALRAGGEVVCWGRNNFGQVGQSETGGTERFTVPATVDGLSEVTAVTATSINTCALREDGQVFCWGIDELGQLGDGRSGRDEHSTPLYSTEPVKVHGVGGYGYLDDVGALATSSGASHLCAVRKSGQAVCWGDNQDGELGNGEHNDFPGQVPREYSSIPVPVKGVGGDGILDRVTTLSATNAHTCALRTWGDALCWGWGGSGQLGDGSTHDDTGEVMPLPVPVKGVTGSGGLTDIRGITAGWLSTCAVLGSAQGVCWGSNAVGQLGNDGETGSGRFSAVPVDVKGLDDVLLHYGPIP